MSLTEFLLARIAEDEAVARTEWPRNEGPHLSPCTLNAPDHMISGEPWCDCGYPDRVLAECEAKRRIVGLHHVGDPEQWDPEQWACRLCQWDEDCDSPKNDYQHSAGRFPCDTLRLLALPYADHPDHREEWKP